MTTKNYNLIDAINREGIGNEEWGVCKDVNTARHFGSSENINLDGMFLYVYHTDGDTWAFLKQSPTYKVTVDDNCQVYLFKI